MPPGFFPGKLVVELLPLTGREFSVVLRHLEVMHKDVAQFLQITGFQGHCSRLSGGLIVIESGVVEEDV